jgi:hypothetical protein
VRFLRDPQRLHNYWRSVIAERLMQSSRARWLVSDMAVAGREKEWRSAHLRDDPLMVWNQDSGAPPVPVPPAQLEPALINEANTSSQDIKDVSNIHEASLGQQSNEVSGKAIIARQRVGETGTVVYHDNLNSAIEQCGRVCNELISVVYDTARIVKILGSDGEAALKSINDPDDPESVDLTSGKYSVTLSTGPSYTTKRVEAAESMMSFINAAPQAFAVAADLIVEAQDWPGAEKISKRLKAAMPPQPDDEPTPEQQQAMQAAAQKQAMAEEFQLEMAKAELRKANAEASEAEARAELARAQAHNVMSDIHNDVILAESKVRSTVLHDTLDTITVADGPPKRPVQEKPNAPRE